MSLSKEMLSNTMTVIYIQFVLVSFGDCNKVKCKEISKGEFNYAKYNFVAHYQISMQPPQLKTGQAYTFQTLYM